MIYDPLAVGSAPPARWYGSLPPPLTLASILTSKMSKFVAMNSLGLGRCSPVPLSEPVKLERRARVAAGIGNTRYSVPYLRVRVRVGGENENWR